MFLSCLVSTGCWSTYCFHRDYTTSTRHPQQRLAFPQLCLLVWLFACPVAALRTPYLETETHQLCRVKRRHIHQTSKCDERMHATWLTNSWRDLGKGTASYLPVSSRSWPNMLKKSHSMVLAYQGKWPRFATNSRNSHKICQICSTENEHTEVIPRRSNVEVRRHALAGLPVWS